MKLLQFLAVQFATVSVLSAAAPSAAEKYTFNNSGSMCFGQTMNLQHPRILNDGSLSASVSVELAALKLGGKGTITSPTIRLLVVDFAFTGEINAKQALEILTRTPQNQITAKITGVPMTYKLMPDELAEKIKKAFG